MKLKASLRAGYYVGHNLQLLMSIKTRGSNQIKKTHEKSISCFCFVTDIFLISSYYFEMKIWDLNSSEDKCISFHNLMSGRENISFPFNFRVFEELNGMILSELRLNMFVSKSKVKQTKHFKTKNTMARSPINGYCLRNQKHRPISRFNIYFERCSSLVLRRLCNWKFIFCIWIEC